MALQLLFYPASSPYPLHPPGSSHLVPATGPLPASAVLYTTSHPPCLTSHSRWVQGQLTAHQPWETSSKKVPYWMLSCMSLHWTSTLVGMTVFTLHEAESHLSSSFSSSVTTILADIDETGREWGKESGKGVSSLHQAIPLSYPLT